MGRSDVAENAREQLLEGIPVAQRRVELAGVSTSVLEGGDGPPVVLLHGPVGHAGHWFRVLPALAKSHRVRPTYRVRGIPSSPGMPWTRTKSLCGWES